MGYDIVPHPQTGNPVIEFQEQGQFGLGCQPRNVSAFNGDFPPLASSYPDIPASQWTEQDNRRYCVPNENQGQSSGCGPASLIEVMGGTFAAEQSLRVRLSMWWAYGQLNRGRDGGTSLPDLLWLAQTRGAPRAQYVQDGNMFGPYGADANNDAQNWKIELAYETATLAAICSAQERQQWCLIGIDIGGNFEPDAEGFLPPYQPSPKGTLGHAMSVCGKKFARGLWWPLVQQHWYPDWGMKGFAFLHPSYLTVGQQFGGWACRMARQTPLDPNKPPVARVG